MGVNLSQNARYSVLKKVDKDSQVVHQDEYSLSKFGIKTSCAEMGTIWYNPVPRVGSRSSIQTEQHILLIISNPGI